MYEWDQLPQTSHPSFSAEESGSNIFENTLCTNDLNCALCETGNKELLKWIGASTGHHKAGLYPNILEAMSERLQVWGQPEVHSGTCPQKLKREGKRQGKKEKSPLFYRALLLEWLTYLYVISSTESLDVLLIYHRKWSDFFDAWRKLHSQWSCYHRMTYDVWGEDVLLQIPKW